MTGPVGAEAVEACWARRRAREHLVLVGVMHAFLVVGMAAAFFAGGDLGRIASAFLGLGALVTTVDIIRTGLRAFVALPADRPDQTDSPPEDLQ